MTSIKRIIDHVIYLYDQLTGTSDNLVSKQNCALETVQSAT